MSEVAPNPALCQSDGGFSELVIEVVRGSELTESVSGEQLKHPAGASGVSLGAGFRAIMGA